MLLRNLSLIALICCATGFAQTVIPLGLKPSGSPVTISLREALERAEIQNNDLAVAREELTQQHARQAKSWYLYTPRLTLDGTLTFNFPEIKINLGGGQQNIVQAQLLKSVAGLLPVGDANRSLFDNQAKVIADTPSSSIMINPATQYVANLTLTQPIFNMQSIALIRAANIDTDRGERNFKYKRSSVYMDVTRAYVEAVRTFRLINVAQNRLKRARDQVSAMRSKYQQSLVRISDVERLEVEAANAHEGVVAATTQYAHSLGKLGLLVGENETFQIEDDIHALPIEQTYSIEDLIAETRYHREDLKAQRLAVKSAQALESATWGAFYPTVSLTGQSKYNSNTSGFVTQALTGTLLLQASWSIFDGGDRYADLASNRSKIRIEKIRLRELEDRMDAEVYGAVADIREKDSALKAAFGVLSLNQTIYRESGELSGQGLIDTTVLIDANQQLSDAELNVENMSLNLALARLELEFYCGK